MCPFLDLELPPHRLLKPGFPRCLPSVVIRDVGEVSGDVKTVGAKWRFAHACLVNLRDDGD